MVLYSIIMLTIVILLLISAMIISYRDNKAFTGHGIVGSKFMEKLIDKVCPAEGTPAYKMWDNVCYVLNSKWRVRDLYLAKFAGLVGGILIGLLIVTSNVTGRYFGAFKVCPEVPIEINRQEFKILTDQVDFNSDDVDEQSNKVYSNIGRLHDVELMKRYKSVDQYNLYMYTKTIDKKLHKIFRFFDPVIIFALAFLGYSIPTLFVSSLVKTLNENIPFEFDDLQIQIYMLAEESTPRILDVLKRSSLLYRQLFIDFSLVYRINPERAYKLVRSRREFPGNFKTLVGYLSMIDESGPEYLKSIIINNQKDSEESIDEIVDRTASKKLGRIKTLLSITFLLSFVRLVISMISMVISGA